MDNRISDVQVRDNLPVAFTRRGRRYEVREILDDWEEAGCWWLEEEPRRVYRVMTDNDTIHELHRLARSGWTTGNEDGRGCQR